MALNNRQATIWSSDDLDCSCICVSGDLNEYWLISCSQFVHWCWSESCEKYKSILTTFDSMFAHITVTELIPLMTWHDHGMETLSAWPPFCEGNLPLAVWFPSKRTSHVTQQNMNYVHLWRFLWDKHKVSIVWNAVWYLFYTQKSCSTA